MVPGHETIVHSVCFSGRSNSSLLAADQSGTVRVWSLETRRPVATFSPSGSTDPVLCVMEVCEGRWLTQTKEGMLGAWDPETASSGGERVAGAKVESHSFCKFEALDENTIAVPDGRDGTEVSLWDSRTPEVGRTRFKPTAVAASATSPSSGKGGAGGEEEAGHAAAMPAASAGPRGPTGSCMSIGSLAPWMFAGGYEDGSVQVWDVRFAGAPVQASRPHAEPVFGLCAAVVPDSKAKNAGSSRGVVASGGAEGTIAVTGWKASSDVASKDQAGESACATFDLADETRIEMRSDGQRGVSSMHARQDGKVSFAPLPLRTERPRVTCAFKSRVWARGYRSMSC